MSKRREAEEPQNREEMDALAALLQQLGLVLSVLAEFGLWILIGLSLLWLYVRRDAWLPYLSRPPRPKGRSPRVELTSGTIAAVDLPTDIPGRVRQLWAEGRNREALSLLYRGSVFALVDRYGVRLPASATEGDCIAAVSAQASGSQAELFRRIVAAWIQLAYGAARPADATIDELTSSWPQHYGGPGA